MDLNQIPSDQMVNVMPFEKIKVGNCANKDSKFESFEVEEKNLALELEIKNKELELEEIKEKLRVFGGEKFRIEYEIKGLKRKLGIEIGDEMLCDGEEDRVDELMVENKVLECEKKAAIKEVGIWKQKCKELEVRVIELEGKLNCQGKARIMTQEGTIDKPNVLPQETSSNKRNLRRRLAFHDDKSSDEKYAPSPSTPIGVGGRGSRPSSTPIIDILDSDNECDPHKGDEILDKEEKSSGGRTTPFNNRTTKSRRDLMVVTSDDESEDRKNTSIKRVLKLENSDEEGQYDDDNNNHGTTPIRQLLKKFAITNESDDDDDDDNIPISQLKRKRGQPSSRPRRRLVKNEKGKEKDKTKNFDENVANDESSDDESSDDESANSDRSLGSFIVSDSDIEEVQNDVREDLEDNSCEMEETSDSDIDFGEMITKLGSRRDRNSKWVGEGDMLADFGKSPELCMKALCALYRQQTNEEKEYKASLIQNGRGFSKFDAERGTYLGEFLTNGDPNSDLVKSVEELQEFDSEGVEDCQKFAKHYSKQLFNIYENEEDPFFLGSPLPSELP